MKRKNYKKISAICLAVFIACNGLIGCGTSPMDEFVSEGADSAPAESAPAEEFVYEGAENTTGTDAYTDGVTEEFETECAMDACEVMIEDYPENYGSNEEYDREDEEAFCNVISNPLSTFSASVDTASYANIRRMIEDGYSLDEIPSDAVRAEEFINYFKYQLNLPKKGEKFGITTEVSQCPWNDKHQLMMVGMRTEAISLEEAPDNNLVFLLDVSGSMSDNNKLPLLQNSFKELVEELDENDRVSIITYASGVNVVLQSARGDEKDVIIEAIDGLYASGSTNGEGGIQRAYEIAKQNFMKKGNNRVILATDGDLNIGVSSPDALEKMIKSKAESGVYLSVLGFGTGNYKDNRMEALAQNGNGNYAYIDSLFEAKKVLVEQMGATFVTVAKDVKLQVEFNPTKVDSYRLIGYENRRMSDQDFYDDTKDAAEIGAGHTVVALYEIVPVGSEDAIDLKYQDKDIEYKAREGVYDKEYGTVAVRYKEPKGTESKEVRIAVGDKNYSKYPSDDFVFASLAAEFAFIVSDSEYKGESSLTQIMDTYRTLEIEDEYKEEFYYLVKMLAKRD